MFDKVAAWIFAPEFLLAFAILQAVAAGYTDKYQSQLGKNVPVFHLCFAIAFFLAAAIVWHIEQN